MTSVRPSERLAPFVRLFRFVETDEEMTRVLVPDGAVVAGFRYRGGACLLEEGSAHRVPTATLAGVRDTVRRMCTSAGGGVLLAVFHEGGASAFTDAPLHELFGATLGLDAVAPAAEVASVADRIANARDHAERVNHFEAFLVACQRQARPDPLIAATVRAIRTDPAGVRIGPLAAELGLSRDRLEKRFRRAVGASPKQLASILRLRRAVDAYRPGVSLTRVSADAGYYDQSHFNRAFRTVTGQAPGPFFGANQHC